MHPAIRGLRCDAIRRFCPRCRTDGFSVREIHHARAHAHTKTTSPIIFSGIQPTGIPHLGNYLGALREWVRIQNDASPDTQLLFSLVDLHAITVRQDPQRLRQWKRESLAILLAIGLDPTRSTLFHQSDVGQHSEFMWILSCMASTGKLDRMTQWKDKTKGESAGNPNSEKQKLGLYAYPVLQAADILLYRATHVPVGEDQAQHLELSRELANTFNHHADAPILVAPQTLLSPASRVMSLTKPSVKMSKSDADEKSRILLTDSAETIRAKIKGAKTDSLGPVSSNLVDRPGVANLLEILSHVSRSSTQAETVEHMAQAREGMSLKDLKDEVTDAIETAIRPVRERFLETIQNEVLLRHVAQQGAARARALAEKTMEEVKGSMGLSF